MKPSADRENRTSRRAPGLLARLLGASRAVLRVPFDIAGVLIKRTAQALFSIFIVILHPGFKWLVALVTRSPLVQKYMIPAFRKIGERYYDAYFTFLRGLPPYWATFSIALPLAALEPAKVYATILVATHPKIGIPLWLFLQGLSIVLIEQTWTAVRPQSRKIWLVSLLHAWGWLNVSYGKYWIRHSVYYRAIIGWQERVRRIARALWTRVATPRRRRVRRRS